MSGPSTLARISKKEQRCGYVTAQTNSCIPAEDFSETEFWAAAQNMGISSKPFTKILGKCRGFTGKDRVYLQVITLSRLAQQTGDLRQILMWCAARVSRGCCNF